MTSVSGLLAIFVAALAMTRSCALYRTQLQKWPLRTVNPRKGRWRLPSRRFIMNAGRTTKQGQQINVGKDHAEYQAIVSTITMHTDDMKEVGVAAGGSVLVRSDNGSARFQCREG